MSEHTIKITASSIESHKAIDKALRKLPKIIYDQIESADQRFTLVATFTSIFKSKPEYWLPNDVSNITTYEDDVVINCVDSEISFKIPSDGIGKEGVQYRMLTKEQMKN